MSRYKLFNGPQPTTAALVGVTTGTVIKTLLQLKGFNVFKVVAWGISFKGFAAAEPVRCELIETGSINATVTAHVAAGAVKLDGADQANVDVAGLTLGTAATGYAATAEGSIVAGRLFDAQYVAPSNQYIYQFPLGQEPKIIIGNVLRIRVHAPAAVDALCWVEVEF